MESRFQNDLPAEGFIWGFPQDIPGAIVQFSQGEKWNARYYATFDHMSRVWSARSKMFMLEDVALVELVEKKKYIRYDTKVFEAGLVVLKLNGRRRKVPLWTSYKAL
jgi:hypothetical protein